MPKSKSFYAIEIFTIPLNMGKTHVFVMESIDACKERLELLLKIENKKDEEELLYTISNRRIIILRVVQNGKIGQEINILPYITYQFSGKTDISIENTNWIDTLFLTLSKHKGIIDEPVKVEFLPIYNSYNMWEVNVKIDWNKIPILTLQEPVIKIGQKVKYISVCANETWYYQLSEYDKKNRIVNFKNNII